MDKSKHKSVAITMRALVRGRVQGVGFRASTRYQANKLQLAGSAINHVDGSVEVLVTGERAAVMALVAWLHQGPALAVVERVDTDEIPPMVFDGFTIG